MKKISIIKNIIFMLCVVSIIILNCSQPISVENGDLGSQISSLEGSFSKGLVTLNWQRPPGDFSHYQLYQTTIVDSLNKPIFGNSTSTILSKELTSYTFSPSPKQGIYYFSIRTAKGSQNILGLLSNVAAITIDPFVRFQINAGQEYTLVKRCTLYVENPKSEIKSLKFTHFVKKFIKQNGILVPAPEEVIPGTVSSSISGDLYGQIASWRASGYHKFVTQTAAAIDSSISIPDFGRSDPFNAVAPPQSSIDTLIKWPWILLSQSGKKIVYCEITYQDNSVDTIFDFIKTSPHRVEVAFRNKKGVGSDGATMRDSTINMPIQDANGKVIDNFERSFIFYNKQIDFNIKNFSDSAIDTDFEYWIITDKQNFKFSNSSIFIISEPIKGSLTGIGDQHDPNTNYSCNIDLTSGNASFKNLYRYNSKTLTPSNGTPQELNSALFNLSENDLNKSGVKQFYMMFRFKERFFNEEIVYVVGWDEVSEAKPSVFTFWDFYRPNLLISSLTDDPNTFKNGSVIAGNFSFIPDTNSVIDGGYQVITDLKLHIAKLPENYIWNTTKAATFTLDSITSNFRDYAKPFGVEFIGSTVKNVKWLNIDPSTWPSGTYIMAVEYTDEFGKNDLLDITTNRSGTTQEPRVWKVTIKTPL